MRRDLAALLIALGAGCSVQPTAPAIAIDHDPLRAFDEVTIRWTPPTAGDITGYAIERRVLPGAFETIGTAPTASKSFRYALPPDTPELTDLEFRVRALPDDDGSRASAAAPLHRGLRAPALACAECPPSSICTDCRSIHGAFTLAITNRSAAADGLLLERGIRHSPSEDPVWTAIPLPPASATYLDAGGAAEWIDCAKFEYRLAAVKGAERSAEVTRAAEPAPPLAPRIVSARAAGAAVELEVENTSRFTPRLSLQRGADPSSGLSIASATAPPPGATVILRDPAPQSSAAFYAVRALSPWYFGAPADAWTIWPPPATDMAVSVALTPPGDVAVRTGAQSFATATLASGDRLALYAASGAPIVVYDDGWLGAPGLALDPAGLPHSVYGRGWPWPCELVHAWHDGDSWHSDDVLPGTSFGGGAVAFDVAPDGTVLAAWGDGWTELAVARRSDAGWSVERLTLGESVRLGPLVAADASGGVHVFVSHWTGSLEVGEHLVRDAAGAWSSEPVPSVSGLVALVAHARGVALVGAASGYAWILERSSAGWGAVEPLGAIGPYDRVRAARSADGERIAVASAGGMLWVRDGAGTVARAWTPMGPFAVGFGDGGRAWVLSGISAYWSRYPNAAALYEEP